MFQIDCQGTCGISAPTKAVVGFPTVDSWNALTATSLYPGVATLMAQPEFYNGVADPIEGPDLYNGVYTSYAGKVCARKAQLTDDDLDTEVRLTTGPVTMRSLTCFHQALSGQVGGHFPTDKEYDPTLCVPEILARKVCDALDSGCHGINMHKSLERAILLIAPCSEAEMEDSLSYDHLAKPQDNVDTEAVDALVQTARIGGISTAHKLLYANHQVESFSFYNMSDYFSKSYFFKIKTL